MNTEIDQDYYRQLICVGDTVIIKPELFNVKVSGIDGDYIILYVDGLGSYFYINRSNLHFSISDSSYHISYSDIELEI